MTKIIEVKMRSMKIAKMLVAAVATLFVTSSVWAQDTLHLTLDDALKVALSENNSVKVAEGENIKITLKSPTQAITIEPAEESDDFKYFYMILPVRMTENQ